MKSMKDGFVRRGLLGGGLRLATSERGNFHGLHALQGRRRSVASRVWEGGAHTKTRRHEGRFDGSGVLLAGLRWGFSLVEVLVAVALIGVLVFLALPNIVQVKDDSEVHLAISRAEALNLAMASAIQAQGIDAAATAWSGAADDDARYLVVRPYLAFAPATRAEYTPGGYTFNFPATLQPLTRVTILRGETPVAY